MKFEIHARMLAWLIAVLLPVVGAGYLATETVEKRLTDRVETDLDNARRLEAARINAALDGYVDDVASFASGPHVQEFTAGVFAERFDPGSFGPIGGYDGFDLIDPESVDPLDQLAAAVNRKARSAGSDALEFRFVGADGDRYGDTEDSVGSPTRHWSTDRSQTARSRSGMRIEARSATTGSAWSPPSCSMVGRSAHCWSRCGWVRSSTS